MTIVLSYRHKTDTKVVGTFASHEAALDAAREHLKGLNVDQEEIADEFGPGWSWKEVVEGWGEFTEGYEEFLFTETETET